MRLPTDIYPELMKAKVVLESSQRLRVRKVHLNRNGQKTEVACQRTNHGKMER